MQNIRMRKSAHAHYTHTLVDESWCSTRTTAAMRAWITAPEDEDPPLATVSALGHVTAAGWRGLNP